MIEAICLGVERDFKDIIRDPAQPGEKPGKGTAVKLAPAAGWLTLLIYDCFGQGWRPGMASVESMNFERAHLSYGTSRLPAYSKWPKSSVNMAVLLELD
jgi:hypothetical protein